MARRTEHRMKVHTCWWDSRNEAFSFSSKPRNASLLLQETWRPAFSKSKFQTYMSSFAFSYRVQKSVCVFSVSFGSRAKHVYVFFLMGAQQYFCFYDREVLVCFCDRCRNVIETCLSFLAKCKRCCWKMCVFMIGCRKVRAFLINWKMLLYVVGLGCNTWPPTKTSWGWGGMLCGGTSTAPPNKQKLGKERWSTCVFARMILFIAEPPKNLAIIYLICPDNFVPMGPLALLSSFSTFKICMPVWG